MIRIAYKNGIYTLLALCLLNAPALAQDCNGTYEEGMALLKKRTQSAVKQAVRKFESAKLCYEVNRDEEGIQNCDTQLAECQQILLKSKSILLTLRLMLVVQLLSSERVKQVFLLMLFDM